MRMCYGLKSTIDPRATCVWVKGINFISHHRTRNCQQPKDELVPRIHPLSQCFEVARPIKKKTPITEQRKRKSNKWLSSGKRSSTHLLWCRVVNGTQGYQTAGWHVCVGGNRSTPEQKLPAVWVGTFQTLRKNTEWICYHWEMGIFFQKRYSIVKIFRLLLIIKCVFSLRWNDEINETEL